MFTLGKRTLVAAAATLALLVAAGSAAAATRPGPPPNAPRYGLQQGGMGGYGVMAGGVVIDAAADYLGVSEADLVAARHAGKSLAQVATEQGKSVSGLEQAIVAAFKANLDKAVAAGRITQAQATQVLATFTAQVKTQVERTAVGPMNGAGRGAGMGLGLGPCGGVNR